MKKVFLIILIFLLNPHIIFAKEESKNDDEHGVNENAKNFFDDGFVVKKQIHKNFNKDTGFTEFEELSPTLTIKNAVQEDNRPLFAENEKEMREVHYIKVFINADDYEHFIREKEKIEDFCLNRNLQLMKFYAVCNNCDEIKVQNTLDGLHQWILAGEFEIIEKIPIQYDLKLSPSYVLGLKNGEVVLVGGDLLEKYVNKNFYIGDFIDNSSKYKKQ